MSATLYREYNYANNKRSSSEPNPDITLSISNIKGVRFNGYGYYSGLTGTSGYSTPYANTSQFCNAKSATIYIRPGTRQSSSFTSYEFYMLVSTSSSNTYYHFYSSQLGSSNPTPFDITFYLADAKSSISIQASSQGKSQTISVSPDKYNRYYGYVKSEWTSSPACNFDLHLICDDSMKTPQPLTKTYYYTFLNNSEIFNKLQINGLSKNSSTFTSITDVHYINTTTEYLSDVTAYSNSAWVTGYNSVLDYTETNPNVTAANTACNSFITFTTRQVSSADIMLGETSFTNIDTIKLKDPEDDTQLKDFIYGFLPTTKTSIKVGSNTLADVGIIHILGTDSVPKSFGYKPAWYQVTIENTCVYTVDIYDGEDENGTLLGSLDSGDTYVYHITSGYVYTSAGMFMEYGASQVASVDSDITLTVVSYNGGGGMN